MKKVPGSFWKGTRFFFLGLSLFTSSYAAVPKSDATGAIVVSDDLSDGSGGSVGLSDGGPINLSGTIGQVSVSTLTNSAGIDDESGYFSKANSIPTNPAYQTVNPSSVTVAWTDGNPPNPAGTLFEAQISTDSQFNTLNPAPILTAGFTATFVSLMQNTVYFTRVRATYMEGDETAYVLFGSTTTLPDNEPPTITDLQTGDNTWRNANTATYNVQFNDTGGSHLNSWTIDVSTVPGDVPGTLLVQGATVQSGLSPSDSYTTPWSLAASTFTALLEGPTNYVTVRVFDGAGNSAKLTDAFYVKKDTTPPTITSNVPVGVESVWRNSDPGPIFNVSFLDRASGLSLIQYSAAASPGNLTPNWMNITNPSPVSPGATFYNTPWDVNFSLLQDGTSYISVQAVDVAGNAAAVADAFYILKDTSGPNVAIIVPAANGFRSSLSSISGTALDSHAVQQVQIAVQNNTVGNTWWDPPTAGFNSPPGTPVYNPASGSGAGSVAWSSSPVTIPWVSGSSYTVVARAVDQAGNFSSVYSTVSFTFDTGVPVANVAAPANASTISALTLITGTAVDPNPGPAPASGVGSVEVEVKRVSDGQWWNFFTETWQATQVSSAAVGTTSWSFNTSPMLQANLATQTSYFITVRASDNAVLPNQGAFSVSGSTFAFLDTTPPAAISDLAGSSTTTPGTIATQWTAPGDDGNSGIILLGKYAIQFSTFSGASFSTAAAQVVFSTAVVRPGTSQGRILTASDGLVAGTTYYLEAWTQDDDGNWSGPSNQAVAVATPLPLNKIEGTVVDLSTNGITGVSVKAYTSSGTLAATTFTLNDGSGTYVLDGLAAGFYKILAAWTANGITSSVSIDNIGMGSVGVGFVLQINYSLASISGQLQSLATSNSSLSDAAVSGYRTQSASPNSVSAFVELWQNGQRIVISQVNSDGTFNLHNLLPGKYSVRAYNGLAYTDMIPVTLLEGENRQLTFAWDPLPEASVFAFPNPARDRVTFRFQSSLDPLEAQILVFDIAGNPVKEIAGSEMSSPQLGLYHADWDLTNSRGEPVASGVYLFMVKVKNAQNGQTAKAIKKLAVIR